MNEKNSHFLFTEMDVHAAVKKVNSSITIFCLQFHICLFLLAFRKKCTYDKSMNGCGHAQITYRTYRLKIMNLL